MAVLDERPDPSLVGTGYANYAAQLAELRRKQKEAVRNDDWAEVDRLEAQIKDVEQKRADAMRNR